LYSDNNKINIKNKPYRDDNKIGCNNEKQDSMFELNKDNKSFKESEDIKQ